MERMWLRVVVGAEHYCALTQDSSIRCWGSNLQGQLGLGTAQTINYLPTPILVPPGTAWKDLAAADNTTCAIKDDGTLWCWGTRDNYFPGSTPQTDWV